MHIEKNLKLAIGLTFIFFLVEVAGSLVSGSLSLLSDAGHMFRDVFALLLTLSAIVISRQLPTEQRTFGTHRVEILAALLNGVILLGISLLIMWEAVHLLAQPRPVRSGVMLVVAIVGFAVNLFIAFRLHGSHDINVKSAFLHVLTDTLSSVAVIVAAVIIFFTGFVLVDPILSLVISFVILVSAALLIRDSARILLEFTPKGTDPKKIAKDIEAVEGVEGVHNMHIWSLCSNINALDAHILTKQDSMEKVEHIKSEIKKKLERHGISHSTLEFECRECMVNGALARLDH